MYPALPPLPCTGPEDIHGGNLKLILGLIWTLIKEYQIKSSGRGMSTKKAMIAWINTVIPEYKISNFGTDWNDGRALCGTVDHIRPGACPNHFALSTSRGVENCTIGMDLAERLFEIPKILSPDDLNNPDVDDLSVMTYISYFRDPANQLLLQWIRKKIPERNIKNLSTDWNDGINLGALVEACFPGVYPDWEQMDPAQAIDNNKRMIGLIKGNLGLECPITATELANPKIDEIVVATYLSGFKNAKLQVSPEEFRLHVPNLPKGSALVREPVTFSINVSSQSPDFLKELKVSAHGPSADAAVMLKPNGSGELQATVTPTEAGKYDIMAVYQGENISGSPFPLPVADPSKCQIFGDIPRYMQVGKPQEITVKARGAGIGSLACNCSPSSESSPSPLLDEVKENKENDEYLITFTPTNIGEVRVELKWCDEHIPQSPFQVSICDASKCFVSGNKDESKVGEPVTLKVTANEKKAGKATPKITPRGPSANYTPEVKDNQDGTYEVKFTPWEVGPHKVDILYGKEPIKGSPLSMNVKAAPDTQSCSAAGKGLKKAIAGVPTSFDLLAPEKGLAAKGKEGIEIDIDSSDGKATHDVVDNEDGTYKVTYTANKPGAYSIAVKCYDKHIPGSPFNLTVVPRADASKCKAEGPALHPNSLKIEGNPLDITVDTTKAGTGDLQVEVIGPDGIEPTVYIASEEGIYSLKFDVPKAGKYLINIKWAGEHIPGSPFKLKVYPGPNAGAVKAYGPGLEPSFEVGEVGEFTIETKNAGIGTLTIRVHGVKGAFKITAEPVQEDNPRMLRAHYDPKEPGDYIVAVRWSGTHVPGSPFNVNIRKKPKPKKVKLPSAKAVSGFDTIPESDGDENSESEGESPSQQKKKKEKEKGKKSSKSPKQAENGKAMASAQQQQLQQLPPSTFIPAFPVSPTRGALHQKIQQGGLMATRSQVIQERKFMSTSTTSTKSVSHTQLDKAKKKKRKF